MPGKGGITNVSSLEMMRRIDGDAPLSSRMEEEINGHIHAVKARNARLLNNPQSANPITGSGEVDSGKNRRASAIIRAPPRTRQLIGGRFRDKQAAVDAGEEEEFDDDNFSNCDDTMSIGASSYKSHATKRSARSSSSSNATNVTTSVRGLALKQEQAELEQELYNVTKKLRHKLAVHNGNAYNKSKSKKGGAMKDLAIQWKKKSGSMTEAQKRQLYMEGRYQTHADFEFYEKEIDESRHMKRNRKKEQAHTKYSDALINQKIALRGTF